MGIRINSNTASIVARRHLERASQEKTKSLSRLASGERIVNSGDDAAGLSMGSQLTAKVRGLEQAQKNTNMGITFIQVAEGAFNEVSNILIRMRELSVLSASDTVGGERERGLLGQEFEQIKQEITRIANSTEFNGKKLINGEGGSDFTFYVGASSGEESIIRFDASGINATAEGLDVDGLSIEDRDDAVDSLSQIDESIIRLNENRAGLGALQSRMHSAANHLSLSIENLSAAKSVILDTDVAKESAALVKSTIQENVALAVLAQANATPASVLKLL